MAGKDLLVTRQSDGGETTLLEYRVPQGFGVEISTEDDHIHVVVAPAPEAKPKRAHKPAARKS